MTNATVSRAARKAPKSREKKAHPYYSFSKILSYNATYNFCVGGRGLGKTYGAKKKAVDDYLKRGEQFIYVRRFKGELANARGTFFSDIAHLYPNHIFRINGDEAQIAAATTEPKEKNAWQTIGYFIALSTGQSQKSRSFPLVTKIIFDEFIIEKGLNHYLPNEAVVFNNLYSTVDRWQDRVKVFFLANSVSIMNPYFMQYDIEPDKADENGIIVAADKFIVAHFPDSKMFAASVFQTKFGKFIKDTDEEYAEYAVGNSFADNNDGLIGAKTYKARYNYTIETKSGSFSVWYNIFTREFTIQEKLPKDQIILTLVPEKMGEGKTLVVYGDKIMQQLRAAFKQARVTFDKPSTRNVFIEVFKR